MTVFEELKRRNVIRVALAYGVASWVLLQVIDVVAPILELPDWTPKLILVILGIGLVPILVFAWAFELTPQGIKREKDVDRSQSITSQTGHRLNYVIVAFLVVAIGLQLINGDRTEQAAETVVAAADEQGDDRSIAVLPFVNMSSDPEQEFFSDGITEEILNSLASVKELKVAGRTSSFAFKGENDDLRRIGEALGVNHILEGSVRTAGAKVRITAQLIQVDDGFHLWSETYDRELTDVFEIQDEIANEILKQLKSHLLDEGVVVKEAKRTNPAVYALYLKAKQRIYTRERTEIESAIEELDRAIQLDPGYAPAYAQRGIATMLLSEQQYGSIPNDESNRRGKRFADQALRLDPDLAEGYAALGLYHTRDRANTDMAIDALVRALEINPNMIDASNWLQIALRDKGDMRASLEILEEVVERDPLYRPAFSNAMQMFNNFGRQDEAEALLKRMEAFDPDNPDLIMARAVNYIFSGRAGEGLRQMEMRNELGDMSGVGQIYLSVGLMRTGQFERVLTEGPRFWHPDALYELGRREEALELAYALARDGDQEALFHYLLRDEREKELVDYFEERWPNLATFAAENPGNDYGYGIMANLATAYRRTGNQERFQEALALVEQRITRLSEQGIDNFAFSANRANYFALAGDADAAFAELESAVAAGYGWPGPLVESDLGFEVFAGDPRIAELDAKILDNVNANRKTVGLPPLNSDYQPEIQ